MRFRDVLMFLPSVCSSFCLSSSMFRSLTPLFGVALHDSNVAVFACMSIFNNRLRVVLFGCCF